MPATLPDTVLTHDRRQWTAADFFSAYRYWALFIALLLMAWAGGLFASCLPMLVHEISTRFGLTTHVATFINSFSLSQNSGWVVGGLLALATLRRGAWPVLLVQIALCAACVAALFLLPSTPPVPGGALEAAFHLLLSLYGLALGTLKAALTIMAVSSLISGRPRRADFAFAFCLLLASAILGWSLGAYSYGFLTMWELDASALVHGISAAVFIGMILILIPARRFAFDDRPRHRHAPPDGPPKPAAAWIPVVMGLLTLAALAGICIIAALNMVAYWNWNWRRNDPEALLFVVWLAALTVLFLVGVVYMAFWFYRIHRQTVALTLSPGLLSPVAATVFVLLAPLGMPLALLLLRDELDEYTVKTAQTGGSASALPAKPLGAWFVVWVLLLPPIAMGMAQHRANRVSRAQPDAPGRSA